MRKLTRYNTRKNFEPWCANKTFFFRAGKGFAVPRRNLKKDREPESFCALMLTWASKLCHFDDTVA